MNPPDLKQQFVFILEMENLVLNAARILALLNERNIEVEVLYLHRISAAEGRFVIHCRMEKDRIGRTVILIKQFPGIFKLDWMESKGRV